jgi:hypothetical protein
MTSQSYIQQKVTVQADSSFNAKYMLEAQYGRGNVSELHEVFSPKKPVEDHTSGLRRREQKEQEEKRRQEDRDREIQELDALENEEDDEGHTPDTEQQHAQSLVSKNYTEEYNSEYSVPEHFFGRPPDLGSLVPERYVGWYAHGSSRWRATWSIITYIILTGFIGVAILLILKYYYLPQ